MGFAEIASEFGISPKLLEAKEIVYVPHTDTIVCLTQDVPTVSCPTHIPNIEILLSGNDVVGIKIFGCRNVLPSPVLQQLRKGFEDAT